MHTEVSTDVRGSITNMCGMVRSANSIVRFTGGCGRCHFLRTRVMERGLLGAECAATLEAEVRLICEPLVKHRYRGHETLELRQAATPHGQC